MNFSEITYYLSSLDMAEAVVALISAALSFGVKILTKSKYKKLNSLLPVLSGVAVNFVVSLIFGEENSFKEVLNEGMRSGGSATVLYVIICGFFKDEYVSVPFENLVAESLLSGFVADEDLEKTAGRCVEILCDALNGVKNRAGEAVKKDGKKTVKVGTLSKKEYEEALEKAETDMADYLAQVIISGGKSTALLLSKTIINVFRATR